jgi:hypothetical protein
MEARWFWYHWKAFFKQNLMVLSTKLFDLVHIMIIAAKVIPLLTFGPLHSSTPHHLIVSATPKTSRMFLVSNRTNLQSYVA